MNLKEMYQSFVETLLWSSVEDGKEFEGTSKDLSKELKDRIMADCKRFLEICQEKGLDLTNFDAGFVGHNFALTRNGHGTGFWDTDCNYADELTEISKEFPQMDIYTGDDGKVYA